MEFLCHSAACSYLYNRYTVDGDTIWVMYILQPLNFLCTLLKKILDKTDCKRAKCMFLLFFVFSQSFPTFSAAVLLEAGWPCWTSGAL